MRGDESDTTTHALQRPDEGWGRRDLYSVLVVVSSPAQERLGLRLVLEPGMHLIGRSAPSTFIIEDGAMSRRHCGVEVGEDGALTIHDFGSRNGTFLDGFRIDDVSSFEGRVLRAGDTLLVLDHPVSKARLPRVSDDVGDDITEIQGWSLATRALRDSVATVARPGGAVLLLGPTGTGKEVAARAIHARSDRDGPFVALNCAAIPDHLAEAELFGFVPGAFTGAETSRRGAFRSAHGGTLFLDEVGELAPGVQAKLLRVLEDRRVRPLGGDEVEPAVVDVRIIAATCADLEDGRFRDDLRARLSDWVLTLDPLAERRADVLALWRFFTEATGREDVEWPMALQEALLAYDWPLNVRELERLLRRVLALTPERSEVELEIFPAAVQAHFRQPSTTAPASAATPPPADAAELRAALTEVEGNVRLLSERKGWARSQIYRWLKRFEVDPDDFR